MKVAIVHDDLIQFGGAERLLMAMHEIWPDAPIYTSVISKEWVKKLKSEGIKYKTSFMQKIPFAVKLNRIFGALGLHLIAFESFDFSGFDVVLSSSARFSHAVVTSPKTTHICYMNSPGRMFWEPYEYFDSEKTSPKNFLLSYLLKRLRTIDYYVSRRPDHFIANSKTPMRRIQKYYKRESKVIYPCVEHSGARVERSDENYLLVLTRLVGWKRVDIAVEAAKKYNFRLVIAGDGPARKDLEKLSQNSSNIEFLGFVDSERKAELYAKCSAFLVTQFEDFGITPLEAMSYGKPVVAFGKGGVLETVLEGVTGEFYKEQSPESLFEVLENFKPQKYDPIKCVEQSQRFSKQRFMTDLRQFVNDVYLSG